MSAYQQSYEDSGASYACCCLLCPVLLGAVRRSLQGLDSPSSFVLTSPPPQSRPTASPSSQHRTTSLPQTSLCLDSH